MRSLAFAGLLVIANVAVGQSDPAADHYRAGVAQFKAGQYAESIQEFRAADAIRPSPVLSFNIAQGYEKLADLPNARLAYQDYLRRAPGADDRQAVENTIASIDQKISQQGHDMVVLVPSTEVEQSARRSSTPNYTLAAVTAGTGVAALVLAGIFNAVSHENSQSLQNDGFNGLYWSRTQAQGYHDTAQNFWTGALISYVAGGVLAATGAGLFTYQLATKPGPP